MCYFRASCSVYKLFQLFKVCPPPLSIPCQIRVDRRSLKIWGRGFKTYSAAVGNDFSLATFIVDWYFCAPIAAFVYFLFFFLTSYCLLQILHIYSSAKQSILIVLCIRVEPLNQPPEPHLSESLEIMFSYLGLGECSFITLHVWQLFYF